LTNSPNNFSNFDLPKSPASLCEQLYEAQDTVNVR
jgi:hypothetical protein